MYLVAPLSCFQECEAKGMVSVILVVSRAEAAKSQRSCGRSLPGMRVIACQESRYLVSSSEKNSEPLPPCQEDCSISVNVGSPVPNLFPPLPISIVEGDWELSCIPRTPPSSFSPHRKLSPSRAKSWVGFLILGPTLTLVVSHRLSCWVRELIFCHVVADHQ